MKVLGIRVDPKKTRYALVAFNNGAYTLLNADGESRLTYPVDLEAPDEKVDWLYRELQRVLHEHPDITRICIKTNEYARGENKSKRESAYLEGVILLFARQKAIPVTAKLYASLATKSSDVKAHAEQRVGRTTLHWDEKIADAVVAAWKGTQP